MRYPISSPKTAGAARDSGSVFAPDDGSELRAEEASGGLLASIQSLARVRIDRARALLIAALLSCATLPYVNVLWNGFVYDDHAQVTNNPYLHSLHHLKEIFTTTVWSYVGAQGVTNYYRPMMMLGYLVCYQIFGPVAYPFHLVSLALHVAIVFLVFRLTVQITGDRVWAFVAAILFALHPIHAESVAWIAAVTDLELTFFFLIAFTLFLRTALPGGKRSEIFAVLTSLAFVLALLSKEQALMLPLLAAVYEHFYRPDRHQTSMRQKLARYGFLWLLGFAYILFRIRFLGALAPVHQMSAVRPRAVVLSALSLLGEYAGKLIWPVRLCAFYVFHPSVSLTDSRVLAGVAVSLVVIAIFIILWRSADSSLHFASFGIVWLLATLAPVLNAHWMAANVFAERYLYLPSVGFCWIVGLAASALWKRAATSRSTRTVFAVAGMLFAGMMAARIVTRNRDWNNDIRLYCQTLADSPDAAPIWNNLGTVYWQNGSIDEADAAWKRALAITPENAIVLNNLGLVASRRKQYTQAVSLFQRATRIKPKYTDPHLNLGETYRNLSQTAAAERELRTAIVLSPLNARAHEELGQLYLDESSFAEAEEQFRASARAGPNTPALDALGDLALRRGDLQSATINFEAALNLDRYDSKAHFGLAHVDLAAGRAADALREYDAGLWSDPANVEAQSEIRKLRQQLSLKPSSAATRP